MLEATLMIHIKIQNFESAEEIMYLITELVLLKNPFVLFLTKVLRSYDVSVYITIVIKNNFMYIE